MFPLEGFPLEKKKIDHKAQIISCLINLPIYSVEPGDVFHEKHCRVFLFDYEKAATNKVNFHPQISRARRLLEGKRL